ncbi:P-type DNA transfer ATPase VirB11 [Legionella pneumophila serogroup 1]|uniref:P-type DNA transfer ATPase VirB11 n=1 Tax=Legionella pneumophila TaxID=446 RepID=UPI00102126B7|nr:P-type DNA transfer ATPase VirB11 [Legionella pneumophila]HAT9682339.1 P-type DNA transfer ATPase VirB11 [Legionella pneumophila subsp. pneumophila]MCH9100162.1 P-type DNA transfer ATPase VirB11 [Legionella pneumophila serogroup 1]MCH9112297.1 P-type DNA transfer ATPase VirB11 [Legionella pneumophila serogroup 1]MDW9159419.1 P-type DNA transfer ATPase VirB11 [Legionella pneumophila]RYX29869.1 P-type DNA transfer ATPase VirB11 [Legionella pneumophila]
MEAIKACFSPGATGLLSPLQDFLDDEHVSEILINKPQEVFIERNGQLIRFDIPVLTPQYLRRLFLLIANENKQTLSENSPVLSGNLGDGSRVQLVIPPASLYETLSIRKFTLKQVSFEEYQAKDFFSSARGVWIKEYSEGHGKTDELLELYYEKNWQEFIRQAILQKKNIIISGGTSSGKTTFLNSCVGQIPLHERLITLEDTYEMDVPHNNIVRLKALKQVGEQVPKLSMQDLVQATLRLRPDRIIMGEIRGREFFDFVSVCSTGHSGALATIHANNPKVAFMRMAQLYKLNQVSGMDEADIYKILDEIIDVIVQLQKTTDGRRLVEVYYKHA